MKKTALWLIVLVFTGVCWADTVFMKDGREIEGLAKKKNGKVIIKLPNGKKIRVSQDDVLYIAKGPLRKKSDESKSDLEPIPPSLPTTLPSQTDTPTTKPASKAPTSSNSTPKRNHTDLVSYSQATEPQQIIYLLMRRRGITQNPRLEDQITQYRAIAHDKKRKIGSKWFTPTDFKRRRKVFSAYYKEACQAIREANKLREKKDLPKKKTLLKTAKTKLNLAARSWADPLLRKFLLAQVEFYEGNYTQAEVLFADCIKQADFIAAFYQGRADTRMALKRYDDALADYMTMMKLKPDSKIALHILRQALANVPGNMIKTKQYKKTLAFCSLYEMNRQRPARKNMKMWLLPGKRQTTRTDRSPLVTPPMDRLVIKQAIAVPLAQNYLVVDKDAVEDALDVVVRLDKDTLVPGKVEKSRKSQLATIKIVGYNFTPVQISSVTPQSSLTAYSVDIYHSMGKEIRSFPVTLKSENAELSPSAGLSPGEAAGPVFDRQGKLAGFLAGKLQYQTDENPDNFITPEKLAPILKKLKKTGEASFRRIKYTNRPKSIAGKTFLLYAITGERFKTDK